MAFPENSQKALLAKHPNAEAVTQVRIISRSGDRFEFEGVLSKNVTAVIVAAAMKLPFTAEVHHACAHPRANWYGDREHGTTFCGVCHKQIEDAIITEAAKKESGALHE